MNDLIIILLFLIPIIIGGFISFIKPRWIITWINKLNYWVIKKEKKYREKNKFSPKYIFKPFFWGLFKIMTWTEHRFKDESLRSGVRITLILYFVALFALILAYLAMVVIGVIIGIVAFFLMIYLIFEWAFGGEKAEIETKRPFFKTARIDRAVFSDDKILRDDMGRKMGTLSKAIISDDQIIKDASGNTVGRITQSVWNNDVQVIKTSGGNKIGEIKTDFWGNRVVVDDSGKKVGTIKKNIWGQTVIKKD